MEHLGGNVQEGNEAKERDPGKYITMSDIWTEVTAETSGLDEGA